MKTMCVFFDTEFTSINPHVDQALISVGLVTVDGREFYAELSDTWQKSMCSTFVLNTVLPLLDGGGARLVEAQVALLLREWIEGLGADEVVLASDAPQFDWHWIAEIFEYHDQWPQNLRRRPNRAYFRHPQHQDRFDLALTEYWQKNGERQHHALVDARSLRYAWHITNRKWRHLASGRIVLAAADKIMPRIADMAQEYFGEILEQVILHGSGAYPEKFREGNSDLDISIVLSDAHRNSLSFWDFVDLVNEQFPNGPWKKVDMVPNTRASIERRRNFELCYEGQVTRGIVYYDCGKDFIGEVLSYDAARADVVSKYISQAWRWVTLTTPNMESATWSACRSACRALHALLVNHEIDVSPRALRWNLPALYMAAVCLYPELETVRQFVYRLPENLAPFDYLDSPCDDLDIYDLKTTIRNRRQLIASSMKIVRRTEHILGLKVSGTSKSNRVLRKLEMDYKLRKLPVVD